MTVAIVQSESAVVGSGTTITATFPATPTVGNTMALVFSCKAPGLVFPITLPAGWTQRLFEWNGADMVVATRVVGAAEPTGVTVTKTTGSFTSGAELAILEVHGAWAGYGYGVANDDATATFPTITPTAHVEALLIATVAARPARSVTVSPTGYTLIEEANGVQRQNTWAKVVADPSGGGYAASVSWDGLVIAELVHAWFTTIDSAVPVADFSADPTEGVAPLTVPFTDESTSTPTSWAWTFGDGDTSTAQHPSHVYAAPGTYSVSLTATNAEGSDTETKTGYIVVLSGVHDAPEPAAAILEIYASSPGSSRWGVATWGNGLWSTAGWQNVTPQGIRVTIRWGSSRPELGILSTPEAASWAVDVYDPDRLLDPSNADSPYQADLVPGLPVRLSHRGTVVRQGVAESIGHEFKVGQSSGYIRATDNISRMANAAVPSDTTLANTLYGRAQDALDAAGLSDITILVQPGANPTLAPWVTGTEASVWQWVTDAALSVLYIPIVDRLGRLTFRAWAAPLFRGRDIGAPELVALQAISDYSGLYSVVVARHLVIDGGALELRALTPPPRYGRRQYTRPDFNDDAGTPDVDAWVEAVLADRAFPGIRWLPGDIRPLTALSTEELARVEAVELVTLSAPDIIESAVVVGGEISVIGKSGDAAQWRFRFAAAQTTIEPLGVDGGAPLDYLLLDPAGDAFLYPD